MKKHFSLAYWFGVVLVMSLIFTSVVNGYSKALLLAIIFTSWYLLKLYPGTW